MLVRPRFILDVYHLLRFEPLLLCFLVLSSFQQFIVGTITI